MTEKATIHEDVKYTPGDGAPITIRPGPADIDRSADSVTLSWSEDDVAGSAAMPKAEFERYVQSGQITLATE